MTAINDVVDGGYVKVKDQWLGIVEIRFVHKHGRMREWFITTEEGVFDMYQIQLYATRAEFEARS